MYAYDEDAGDNGEVTYRLSHDQQDTDPGFFSVDPYSGLIRCHRELDRETNDKYLLRLEALDAGTPRLSATATILLSVEDVNDNAPRFTRLYSLNVTENAPVGTRYARTPGPYFLDGFSSPHFRSSAIRVTHV